MDDSGARSLDDLLATMKALIEAEPPEPIKLTVEQWSDLRTRYAPLGTPWRRDGALGDITGVSVELVDSVEESTPYQVQLAASVTKQQVAPREPQVDDHPWANPRLIERRGQPGWLDRLFARLFGGSS